MGGVISNLSRDSSIEGIEIAEPVTIIELIYILDDPSLDGVVLIFPILISENSSLLTTNTTGTVPDDLFSLCSLAVSFEEFWYLAEVDCTSGDRIFEVTETILIVIAHIEDEVLIRFSPVEDIFKFFWSQLFFMFFDLIGRHLDPERHDLIAELDTHTRKLVTAYRGGLGIDIGDILEILRFLEKPTIRLALTEIARHSGADALRADIDASLESEVTGEVEMLLSDLIELCLRDIDKLIKCQKFVLRLVPSIQLGNHI